MKKIILDFSDVIDEYVLTRTEPCEEDAPETEAPRVTLADVPENRSRSFREMVHDYLARQMEFPDYYGHNLDALYECLTDICEPVAVGFFLPCPDMDEIPLEAMMYLEKVKKVFLDAERDNGDSLAVITMDEAGYAPEDYSGDPDDELAALFAGLRFE